jgi:hypothetical protein
MCPLSTPEFQPFLIGLKITHLLKIVNTKAISEIYTNVEQLNLTYPNLTLA